MNWEEKILKNGQFNLIMFIVFHSFNFKLNDVKSP